MRFGILKLRFRGSLLVERSHELRLLVCSLELSRKKRKRRGRRGRRRKRKVWQERMKECGSKWTCRKRRDEGCGNVNGKPQGWALLHAQNACLRLHHRRSGGRRAKRSLRSLGAVSCADWPGSAGPKPKDPQWQTPLVGLCGAPMESELAASLPTIDHRGNAKPNQVKERRGSSYRRATGWPRRSRQ
jgi:hypothetical protein